VNRAVVGTVATSPLCSDYCIVKTVISAANTLDSDYLLFVVTIVH